MIRRLVRRRFAHTISDTVCRHLSRLSAQWEESVNHALSRVENEARRRLDELVETIERLMEKSGNERAALIRADLERLQSARKSMSS